MMLLNIVMTIFMLCFFGFLIYIIVRGVRTFIDYPKLFRNGMAEIEDHLAQSDFTPEQIIGHTNRMNCTASYYLFIDYEKEQWLMTSPVSAEKDLTIRSFKDVIAVDVFDEDANTWVDKLPATGRNKNMSVTGSYGIRVRTTKSPLIYDFMKSGVGRAAVKSAPRLDRNTKAFKQDEVTISEQVSAFEDMIHKNKS